MPFINRFARMFSADLNALLDRLEEPELLLKQAVRDMSEELGLLERRARLLEQSAQRQEREESAARETLAGIDEELDLCFAAGEDALARDLVRRQLEQRRRAERAADEARRQREAAAALALEIESGRRELKFMREQLALFDDGAASTPPAAGVGPVTEQEIDVALLRERQRRGAR